MFQPAEIASKSRKS